MHTLCTIATSSLTFPQVLPDGKLEISLTAGQSAESEALVDPGFKDESLGAVSLYDEEWKKEVEVLTLVGKLTSMKPVTPERCAARVCGSPTV